jgi:hypothetical protein
LYQLPKQSAHIKTSNTYGVEDWKSSSKLTQRNLNSKFALGGKSVSLKPSSHQCCFKTCGSKINSKDMEKQKPSEVAFWAGPVVSERSSLKNEDQWPHTPIIWINVQWNN